MAAKKRTKAKETFSRYDSADYLTSEEDIAAYLEAAMENADDNVAVIVNALGVAARARGMMQLAKDTGITRAGLYRALSAEGNPSFATVLKVMKALGVKLRPEAA
jgi:probable addiction module antidote protein